MVEMNAVQQAFLEAYRFKTEDEIPANYVPIFIEKNGNDPVLLPGYACSPKAKAKIEFKTTAPEGLWLCGAAVMIYTPQGIVSIPDRRNGGNLGPSAQGMSLYNEGANLDHTALRELGEEITAYVLAGEGDNLYQSCTEIVPAGLIPIGRVDALNLAFDTALVFGEVKFLTYCRYPQDRVWIYVGLWDLRQLPNADRLRIIWDDDFPQERHPGTNPRVLDYKTRKEVGRFEGLQGYLPNDMTFHSVLDVTFTTL